MSSQEGRGSLCADAQSVLASMFLGPDRVDPRGWSTPPLTKPFLGQSLTKGQGGGFQERGSILGRIQQDDHVASLGAGDDVSFKAVLGRGFLPHLIRRRESTLLFA